MKYSYSNMGSYLYSRLPHYHKVVDEQNELLLKRFMEVFNVGFKVNDEDLKKALEKTQASKCGEESLEELAKSLGADWISTIDPSYQRTIVRMLIKLYKQKGTIDTIRFIASELSGFEAKIIEGEIPDEYFKEGDEKKRLLTVKLQAPELDDPIQAQQHETTIAEVIDKFLPVHTKCVLVVTYFYSEDYYKRITYKDVQHLNQKLDGGFKVFRDDYSTKDKLKHLYNIESNFKMIGHPDVLGLTTNPLYLLNSTMHTTKTRYDILHHTDLVIKTEYTKIFDAETTESKESIKLSDLNEQEAILDIKYDKVEKVMVQSILENQPTTDLGLDKYVIRTNTKNCKLATKEGRLTTPSYIDKIYIGGQISYNYE